MSTKVKLPYQYDEYKSEPTYLDNHFITNFEEPFGEKNPKGEEFPYLVNLWWFIDNITLISTLEPLEFVLLWSFLGIEKVDKRNSNLGFEFGSVRLSLGLG